MCECFKIGGPFIAEDPDCPEHGAQALAREEEMRKFARELRGQISNADTVEDLKDVLHNIVDRLLP